MQLNRPSILRLIPILPLFAVPAIAAPAQQEQLDQSRAQEAERQNRLGEERMEAIVPPPPSADLPADESVRFHISHKKDPYCGKIKITTVGIRQSPLTCRNRHWKNSTDRTTVSIERKLRF